MTRILLSLMSIAWLPSPLLSSAFAVEFSVATQDGLAKIQGQIDLPSCGERRAPAVLMVGGTGLFSRNAYFGRSGTDRDFLFADLSKKLNAACIATIRFDFRGVLCDLKGAPSLRNCVNQTGRASVTDRTILDDIRAVYEFASLHEGIDSKRLFILGHSEGSLNTARLVAEGLRPAGLLFIGGITESAKSILHWQIVGRNAEWAFEMDSNRDQVLTNEEIKLNFTHSKFSQITTPENLLSPTGTWTFEGFMKLMDSQYGEIAAEALAKNDEEPHVNSGVVYSSHAWWKRWFKDDTSVLENLADYGGPIKYRNGDMDSQSPGLRELKYLETSGVKMKSKPLFVVHEGKGHGLGSDPLYGPIDENITDQIVSDFSSWSQRP